MYKKIIYTILTIVLAVPTFVNAQSKPKRDTSKDKSVVVKITQKKYEKNAVKTTSSTRGKSIKQSFNSRTYKKTNKANGDVVLKLSKTNLNFGASNASETIVITSTPLWSIFVPPASWVHITTNRNTLFLSVDANPMTSVRTDSFVIKAGNKTQRVDITQQGATPYLTISKDYVSFFSSGGTEYFTVNCNGIWEIKTHPYSWGHLSRDGRTLKLSIDPNSTTSERTDYFVIKCGDIEKRVNITQTGRNSGVSSYNYGYSYGYNSNTNTYIHENWWKDRVRIGWNITAFDFNFNNEHLSWKTGLRCRFGKYSDLFNFIVGCDYSLQKGYDSKIANEIFIPIECRLNYAKCGSLGRLYLGTGFDVGFTLSRRNYTSYAIDPMLGVMCKHFDFGIDYRIYLEGNSNRFGFFATWYF